MLKQMIKDEIKDRIFGKDEMEKQQRFAFYLAIMLLLYGWIFSYDSNVNIKVDNSYIPGVTLNN